MRTRIRATTKPTRSIRFRSFFARRRAQLESSEMNTMHGGLFAGEIKLIQLGDELEESGSASYLIAGYGLERAGLLLDKSTKGQVMFGEDAEILTSATIIEAKFNRPTFKIPKIRVPIYGISYCSTLTHHRVQSTKAAAGMLHLSNDIRKVTVMFISLPDIEKRAKSQELFTDENLQDFNDIFKALTSCIVKYKGACECCCCCFGFGDFVIYSYIT